MKEKKWILYSLAAALLACAVIWAGALKRVDRWVQDALFQHPAATNTDIVLIETMIEFEIDPEEY